nr:MAG TPA: hypothetical protein [Caudoviricetes sp.]
MPLLRGGCIETIIYRCRIAVNRHNRRHNPMPILKKYNYG